MEKGTELPPNTATSSSTSLPPRAPDLLRQAQAVFKRHRPLTAGVVRPSGSGDRRLMGVALEGKGEAGAAAAPRSECGGDSSNSARAVADAGSRERLGLRGAASVRQANDGTNSGSEQKSRQLVSLDHGLVQVKEKEWLFSSDKMDISGSRPYSTKNEGVLDNEVYCNNFNLDEFQRRNSHQEEMVDVRTLSAKKDLFSTGGSSCSTATCLTTASVPMPSSSQNVSLSETKEDFNIYGRPKTDGNSVVTLQPRSVEKPTQMPESTRVSASAPDVSVVTHEVNFPKSQNLTKKEADSSGVIHTEDKYVNDQQKIGEDLQSRDVALKKLPSSTVVDASKPSKLEKDTRKKIHNSDVFFKVNGKRYQNLGKIGSGGSSEVHKVISSDCTIYALKKINLKGRDYSAAHGFCQEIEYLKTLKGKSHIIELIDYEVTDKTFQIVTDGLTAAKDGKFRADGYIYMVLEYGEIDLAHMLLQKWRDMNNSNSNLDENWLRFYWQQILLAVNTIHEERIVHSDLKPANFLLVRGSLKLIDFGIAKAIMNDTTNIQRDAQVGTLNYMSPEAFMWNEQDATGSTIKCGRPSDIWSLGCILYQMVYGRTPFSEYKTFWSKFKVITDRNYQIKYEAVSNPYLIDLMKRCLAWDKDARWRIPELMKHPFLNPPVLPHSEPSSSYHMKLLMEIAESYSNNQEVYGLFSKLQMMIADLEDD